MCVLLQCRSRAHIVSQYKYDASNPLVPIGCLRDRQLMEAAGPNTGLTTEHLKSHLQKYRLNYDRSRAEFLEFYDQSHKRNHKRRRKNGSKPGEPNTMFVFPITHKKPRKGASDDDDSDSDDAADDRDDAMSDSTLEHVTPRSSSASLHRTESSASLERTSSFTSMMHDPKDQLNTVALAFAQQQQQYIQVRTSAPTLFLSGQVWYPFLCLVSVCSDDEREQCGRSLELQWRNDVDSGVCCRWFVAKRKPHGTVARQHPPRKQRRCSNEPPCGRSSSSSGVPAAVRPLDERCWRGNGHWQRGKHSDRTAGW